MPMTLATHQDDAWLPGRTPVADRLRRSCLADHDAAPGGEPGEVIRPDQGVALADPVNPGGIVQLQRAAGDAGHKDEMPAALLRDAPRPADPRVHGGDHG